jgi:hypothetical protein
LCLMRKMTLLWTLSTAKASGATGTVAGAGRGPHRRGGRSRPGQGCRRRRGCRLDTCACGQLLNGEPTAPDRRPGARTSTRHERSRRAGMNIREHPVSKDSGYVRASRTDATAAVRGIPRGGPETKGVRSVEMQHPPIRGRIGRSRRRGDAGGGILSRAATKTATPTCVVRWDKCRAARLAIKDPPCPATVSVRSPASCSP